MQYMKNSKRGSDNEDDDRTRELPSVMEEKGEINDRDEEFDEIDQN